MKVIKIWRIPWWVEFCRGHWGQLLGRRSSSRGHWLYRDVPWHCHTPRNASLLQSNSKFSIITSNTNLGFFLFYYTYHLYSVFSQKELEVPTTVSLCNMLELNSLIKFKILAIRYECNYFYVNYDKGSLFAILHVS